MQIKIDLSKSLEENASNYFDASKKAKKKLKGVTEAIEQTKKHEAKKTVEPVEKKIATRTRKRHWYEKFRWFLSSDDYFCIAGRDAMTNEIVIKKHTDQEDWVFHTDMAGSPFTVIKAKGHEGDVPDTTMDEAAQFTASMGRGWKNGLAALEVFYVKPDQVTKKAQAGEALPRGAFMIRGKTIYKRPKLALAACLIEYDKVTHIMVASRSACEKHAQGKILDIIQGKDKSSDVAKQLQRLLEAKEIPLDEILRQLPSGGVMLKK